MIDSAVSFSSMRTGPLATSALANRAHEITRPVHNQDCRLSDRICSMFDAIALLLQARNAAANATHREILAENERIHLRLVSMGRIVNYAP
jgi:hypothetical protein